MNKYLRFGQYLLKNGLVDALDILKAGLIQKKNNLKIGELTKAKGWLTEDDILKNIDKTGRLLYIFWRGVGSDRSHISRRSNKTA